MGFLKSAWDLVRALKKGSYDKVLGIILPLLFENKVLGAFLAKNKTAVGYILTVVGFALSEALAWWPDLSWVGPVEAQYTMILGLILTGLGIQHRGVKERRDN